MICVLDNLHTCNNCLFMTCTFTYVIFILFKRTPTYIGIDMILYHFLYQFIVSIDLFLFIMFIYTFILNCLYVNIFSHLLYIF